MVWGIIRQGPYYISEATCESIASRLKKFAATGCSAGRAVTKTVLREGDIMADAFILRSWAEVKKPLTRVENAAQLLLE